MLEFTFERRSPLFEVGKFSKAARRRIARGLRAEVLKFPLELLAPGERLFEPQFEGFSVRRMLTARSVYAGAKRRELILQSSQVGRAFPGLHPHMRGLVRQRLSLAIQADLFALDCDERILGVPGEGQDLAEQPAAALEEVAKRLHAFPQRRS